jgi:hypothetical protein
LKVGDGKKVNGPAVELPQLGAWGSRRMLVEATLMTLELV